MKEMERLPALFESAYLGLLDWWNEAWILSGLYKLSWQELAFLFLEGLQLKLTCKLGLCDECPVCETWYCWSCMSRVPWDNGCADDAPDLCDDCWADAHWKEDAYDGGRVGSPRGGRPCEGACHCL